MELRAADFASFFHAIHGHEPFPWQQALVERLADSDLWPDVLDLPTGSGKTAALDAAVFHLALRAATPWKAALRIALVVDRRLVVDDAFGRAERIAEALRRAQAGGRGVSGVLREVARRLQGLAGPGHPPLVAKRLRGGAPLEHDWAYTPTQPTVLCSTVDQVGSRLLFRGYGVSDGMKPVHAGLLGFNSLILLDEAHLSEPFRQTLEAVRKIGRAGVSVALLSATPGAKAERPFRLTQADRGHPVLRTRLEANKWAVLGRKIQGSEEAAAKAFAKEACEMMKCLKQNGVSSPAVGVVVNRVALARSTFEHLNADAAVAEADTVLMIGPSRSVDRDQIVAALTPFRTASCRTQAKPLVVVATQCLEVGVDLDLDGLVTQAASLDALRQRFGRLNRSGQRAASMGAVLARSQDVAKKADDPVYGNRIRLTWEALHSIAEDRRVDFGVEALPKRLQEAGLEPESLTAARPDAPVMMPAYLDLLSHTSPRPAAGPDVSLFLHGAERTTAGVSIVWRDDISAAELQEGSQDPLGELLRLVPPRSAEAIEVPLSAARSWLRQRGGAPTDVADAPERETGPDDGVASDQGASRRAFRWAGYDDLRTGIVKPDDLRFGDLVVVPSEYGGCDRFGWAPDLMDPVVDVADGAAKPYWKRRCAARVHSGLARTDREWSRLQAVLDDESLAPLELVKGLLEVLLSSWAREEDRNGGGGVRTGETTEALKGMRTAKGRIAVHLPYGRGGRRDGAVLVADRGVQGVAPPAARLPATEDETTSLSADKPVCLDDHCRRVADHVRRSSRALGLKEVDDLVLAADLHDAGKADARFQVMLSGGNAWNRPDGPALAKSGRSWSPTSWERSGLPKGWRHEALSIRMAQVHPRFASACDPGLVLWLIGTHHGRGRPFFGFVDSEPEPPQPCLGVDDWKLAEDAGPQYAAFDLAGRDWPALFED